MCTVRALFGVHCASSNTFPRYSVPTASPQSFYNCSNLTFLELLVAHVSSVLKVEQPGLQSRDKNVFGRECILLPPSSKSFDRLKALRPAVDTVQLISFDRVAGQ